MNTLRLLPAYLVVFVGFVGYSMMIAVFTPMFLQGYGHLISPDMTTANKTILLGIVLCMYPLGQFLSSPVIGEFADKYGRRPVLLISLALCVVCYVLLACAIKMESMTLLIVMLVATGLTEGNIVIAQSTISDVSDAINRGRLFGYIYMSASLAYVVGPLAGGKLASPAVVSWFSYVTPFWAMAILLFLTFVGALLFFKETHSPEPSEPIRLGVALTGLTAVFRPGPLRILYMINFACYMGIFGFFRCYPMYMVDEFHMNVSEVSEFIAWLSVPIVIANLGLAGYFTAKFPPQKVVIWSGVLTALAMILIVIPSSQGFLWVTLFLVGLPLSVCMTACATLLSISAPANEQGRALGNNQALQVFAESTSGLVGGLVAAILIKASLPAMAAFILIGVAVLLLRNRSRVSTK
ncbi:MAG: MFS transporter [Chthoniobacterales bacterium]